MFAIMHNQLLNRAAARICGRQMMMAGWLAGLICVRLGNQFVFVRVCGGKSSYYCWYSLRRPKNNKPSTSARTNIHTNVRTHYSHMIDD